MEKATFAAGCFWGIEAAFKLVPGVKTTRVGYAGGSADKPTYEQICSGSTGHAESCEIVFDPKRITYEMLLDIYWRIHDPTQMNRQGNDVGTQYRSIIFYHSSEQNEKALASKKELETKLGKPIVTEVIPAAEFWPAEDYHQDYINNNPGGYCHVDLNAVREYVRTLKLKL